MTSQQAVRDIQLIQRIQEDPLVYDSIDIISGRNRNINDETRLRDKPQGNVVARLDPSSYVYEIAHRRTIAR